jgi:hypothetical protein
MLGTSSQPFVEANMAYQRERIMAAYPRTGRRIRLHWPHFGRRHVGGQTPTEPIVSGAPHHRRPIGVRLFP